jgi:hypothetical protein
MWAAILAVDWLPAARDKPPITPVDQRPWINARGPMPVDRHAPGNTLGHPWTCNLGAQPMLKTRAHDQACNPDSRPAMTFGHDLQHVRWVIPGASPS